MLDEILRRLGWYRRPNQYVDCIEVRQFTIEDGSITPSDFLEEQDYFRIVGSKRNDGLYQYPSAELTDEEFNGAVWVMRVPPALVTLAQQYKEELEKESGKPSAYISESFGGYSYTKATNSKGVPLNWEHLHADELNQWRIM